MKLRIAKKIRRKHYSRPFGPFTWDSPYTSHQLFRAEQRLRKIRFLRLRQLYKVSENPAYDKLKFLFRDPKGRFVRKLYTSTAYGKLSAKSTP